ncbi:MAG: hypothetical protein D6759_20525, partial [Chloroflexi bacterium]
MRARLFPLALALILTVALTLLLRGLVRELIILPLLQLYWVARILLESVPQLLLWGLFVGLAFLIAGGSLLRWQREQERTESERRPHPGRVATWARWIRQAEEGDYSRWRLAHQLGGLALDLLAYRQQCPQEQVKRQLEEGTLAMPPEVRAYLRAGLGRGIWGPSGRLGRLWHRLRGT